MAFKRKRIYILTVDDGGNERRCRDTVSEEIYRTRGFDDYAVVAFGCMSHIDEPLDWDISNDDENEEAQFFRDYMGLEEMEVKRALLQAIYKAVQQASMSGDTLKSLTKNALAYIIKDPDRDVHDRLKRYKKFCEVQYKDSEQD